MGEASVIRMRGALDGVDARTREVFRMYRLEGMTYAQISWRTGLATSAIEKHLASALVALAGAMEEG
jgi:RNA polymerase sigma-70 factor (ECF subfamily)